MSVAVHQHTQDVCGCLCVNVCVRVCPSAHTGRLWVSVGTHRRVVSVHQYTYQHVGPWTHHAGPSRGLFGTHRTSVGVRQHTHDVCGCPWLSVSTHMTSVAIRGYPCVSVTHTGYPTHRTYVGVRQHTQDVRGCSCVSVCLCVSAKAHRTSVAVH
ncbi:unnamed protein product [Brassica rapa]|uniref:Uncharacterized protein n=1 Tax=Brassica campestris TaxID=3711 RepID=A0A8D9DAU3_BRACM|nr:unnamed protein product [Brassica rapa]